MVWRIEKLMLFGLTVKIFITLGEIITATLKSWKLFNPYGHF